MDSHSILKGESAVSNAWIVFLSSWKAVIWKIIIEMEDIQMDNENVSYS